jgi:hypothetical protein
MPSRPRISLALYPGYDGADRKLASCPETPENIMKIELYYAPVTCALAPYITLTEAKAPFEVRPLNFRKNQHNSPDYLKLNPKHKVPLLIVDGRILSESVAIQTWIARTFPQAKLLPADPWEELQAVSLMSWCSGGIHPFLARINSPPRVCDVPGTEDSVKKLATANLMELFKIAWSCSRSPTTGSPGASSSSITSPRRMRTSSGASAARASSSSTSRASSTARRISNA